MKTPQEVLDAWDLCHEERDYSTELRGGLCLYAVRGEKGISIHFGEHDSAIRAALEKQVPKAPNASPHKDGGGNKYSEFFCASCGNGLGHNRYGCLYNIHMESVNDYCENCGQAIEWDGCER